MMQFQALHGKTAFTEMILVREPLKEKKIELNRFSDK
jgi:hypothetical protein